MKDTQYKALLKELQKLEKAIAKAGVSAVRASAPLHDRVKAHHIVSETGGSFDEYVGIVAGRSAVQFLLRTVYVRVLEDLGLLDPPRIRGQRSFQAFREVAPALGVRSYFKWTFRDLAHDFPALFTPISEELPMPAEDLCLKVWELWHAEDGKGNLVYDWSDRNFNSRFLGDLYQDLDTDVRKRFALLQTPDFVEAYILDQTLTPALVEFDPETLRAREQTFRVLDPTCGSGHFLIGAFRRLTTYWKGKGLADWEAAQRALESVWGCDINSHAVDIARVRLLLEVMTMSGRRDLEHLGTLSLNLKTLDSLIPWEKGRGIQDELFREQDQLSKYATPVEREQNGQFLTHDFHVVVGNPPYVAPKDPQKRDDYRKFWPSSATGKYALSAPYVQRLFSLGLTGAFVGMINANSFMRRSFGRQLVESVLPLLDLTCIVDSQGANIPGHDAFPTVILLGRNQPPLAKTIRTVVGLKRTANPNFFGRDDAVWNDIVEHSEHPGFKSDVVAVLDEPRATYASFPWNMTRGVATQIAEQMEFKRQRLGGRVSAAGFNAITSATELLHLTADHVRRSGIEASICWPVVEGSSVRDYYVANSHWFPVPYDENLDLVQLERLPGLHRFVWPHRVWLRKRFVSGGTTMDDVDLPYHAIPQFSKKKLRRARTISFGEVATHGHFALIHRRALFERSAPMIQPGFRVCMVT